MDKLPTPGDLLKDLRHKHPVLEGMHGMRWIEILKMYEGTGEVGEVRTQSDWEKLPKEPTNEPRRIRFVVLREDEGPVVRWAIDDFLKEWGGENHPTHNGLVGYRGDAPQNARSGYIYISTNGSIEKIG